MRPDGVFAVLCMHSCLMQYFSHGKLPCNFFHANGGERRSCRPEGLVSPATGCGVEVGGPRGKAGTETFFIFEVALAASLLTNV